MKKILKVSLLLILILTISVEAKGKASIGKAVGKIAVKSFKKSIPKIKKMINSSKKAKTIARKQIRKNVPKGLTGLYKFKASNNKPYLGKSVKSKKGQDIRKRLIQHINSGKLHPKDVKTISYAKVAKKDVSEVEKQKIKSADIKTHGGLANNHHAPWSREKSKVITQGRKNREELNKSLLKTKF